MYILADSETFAVQMCNKSNLCIGGLVVHNSVNIRLCVGEKGGALFEDAKHYLPGGLLPGVEVQLEFYDPKYPKQPLARVSTDAPLNPKYIYSLLESGEAERQSASYSAIFYSYTL